jgi:hypothetical protein
MGRRYLLKNVNIHGYLRRNENATEENAVSEIL